MLNTLAAAHAEAGNFDRAVEYQMKAISLVDEKHTDQYRQRLDLYRNGKPYRETGPDESIQAEP